MVRCSVCDIEIERNYCPQCGQYHTGRRITNKSLLLDLVNGLYSLDKSFYENMKLGLFRPAKLVRNYWEGYRRYYFSPGKFLTIASLFLVLNFLIQDDFFSITVVSDGIGPHFVFLFILLSLYSLSSWGVYYLYGKNFNEHFVLNIYSISIWIICITPFSILWGYLNVEGVEELWTAFLLLVIGVWNNRVFKMVWWKRILYIAANYTVLTLLFYVLLHASNFNGDF